MAPLLQISNLAIAYRLARGAELRAISGFDLTLERGKVVGVVGQSGAGKSTIGKAVLGLLGDNADIVEGSIIFDGQELSKFSESQFAAIRGKKVGYIYQNPMSALNPVLSIGEQIVEAIEANTSRRGTEARAHAIVLLHSGSEGRREG